jgi:hypothetical protein
MLDHEASTPEWIRRFTALAVPGLDQASPDRLAMIGNLEGPGGRGARSFRRRVVPASDEPIGVESVWMLPDGRVACGDVTGDERAPWWRLPSLGWNARSSEIPSWLTGLSFEAGRAR